MGNNLKLAAGLLLLAALASNAHAALRSPQVSVSGTALATFFASQGQAIDVNADQLDAQRFNLPALGTLHPRVFGPVAASFGAYNASALAPPLYELLPSAMLPGWFVTAGFRDAPVRLVVNLFDAQSALQGNNVYLGADRTDLGFYAQLPGGQAWSQDARNPAGRVLMLAYQGTGLHAGELWLACESTQATGGDYADAIALVDLSLGPVPIAKSSWGRMKALFR